MREGKARGSELVIYDDGTLYHIDLKRADRIPPNLFFVGAADRVDTIAKYFDTVTFRHRNKSRPEFYTITGRYKNIPIAVMSTGIGPDNIEIIMNELHALFEYNHRSDTWSRKPAKVNIIRIGTAGTSLKEIPGGALTISKYSIGLDNLGAYYPPKKQDAVTRTIEKDFLKTRIGKINPLSYVASASPKVVAALEGAAKKIDGARVFSGLTTASPGFFAPEGRTIGRMKTALKLEQFVREVSTFSTRGLRIINHEMETSSLFRLGNEILGYNAGAICVVVDNLSTDEFIDKKRAEKCMDHCIKIALEAMVKLARN